MSELNEEEVKLPSVGLDTLLGFVGFAVSIASFFGAYAFLPNSLNSPEQSVMFRLVGAFVLVIAFAFIRAFSEKIGASSGKILLWAGVTECLGALLLLVPFFDGGSIAISIIATVLINCGGACLGILWFVQLCQFTGKILIGFIAMGIVIGASLVFGMSFMGTYGIRIAVFACALGSFLCLFFDHYVHPSIFKCTVSNNDSDKRTRIRMPSIVMLSLTFFQVGFVLSFSHFVDIVSICLIVIIASSIIITIDCFNGAVINERNLAPINPPLTVLSFMLIFMFGHVTQIVALSLITALSLVYIISGWTALVSHTRLCRLSPYRIYAKSRVVDYVGLFLGITSGYVAGALPREYAAIVTVCIAAVICALSLISHTPRFPENGFNEVSSAVASRGRITWDQRCHALAEKYDLSERQLEVLVLLTQGRNAKYIESSLLISLSTVQTHIRNIYRKVGVHSRQELLDLIEGMKIYGEV